MTIKTIQNLVSEAMSEIKTIDADEAYQMVQNKNCNLIDIRESNELETLVVLKEQVIFQEECLKYI